MWLMDSTCIDLWIAKAMSGLDIIKYISLLIHLLYKERSSIRSLSLRLCFKLGSVGNVVDLLSKNPVSSNKDKIYFLWLKETPFWNLAISNNL